MIVKDISRLGTRPVTNRHSAVRKTNDGSGRMRIRRVGVTPPLFPYLLAAPALILFLGVIAYPFSQSLLDGFFKRSLLTNVSTYVGLSNLQALVSSSSFWQVVEQTAVFVGVSTLGAFVVALFLALALNTRIPAKGFLRTAFLVPWILPGVVVSFLWSWIFDTNYGVLNGIISLLGGGHGVGINWLATPGLAMIAIIIAKIWHSFPWMMILILAALQGIPAETHDAAAVDGASAWKKQFFVILPQIRPALALCLLLETIYSLQQFDIPYVMTGGGPVGTTTTLSVDLYNTAFTDYNLGAAGAIGIAWTVLMAGLVVAYMIFTVRHESREG